MRKINWEDLPSRATPINADNLNAMQDNIETEIEGKTQKDIITIYLDNTITNPTVETYTKVPLTLKARVGNKLIISNNGILIGSGVHHIKVSAKMEFDTGSVFSSRYIRITKGDIGALDDNTLAWCVQDFKENVASYLVIPEFLCSVEEGNLISLFYYMRNGDKISGNSSILRTHLTVEVVD